MLLEVKVQWRLGGVSDFDSVELCIEFFIESMYTLPRSKLPNS